MQLRASTTRDCTLLLGTRSCLPLLASPPAGTTLPGDHNKAQEQPDNDYSCCRRGGVPATSLAPPPPALRAVVGVVPTYQGWLALTCRRLMDANVACT